MDQGLLCSATKYVFFLFYICTTFLNILEIDSIITLEAYGQVSQVGRGSVGDFSFESYQ